jgi:hypothetical protein
MNIKIVYFTYLVPNKWQSIVEEQLNSLYKLTSLYNKSEIYMSVIDTSESQKELEKLRSILSKKYNKIQLINIFSTNVMEYPGIKTVYELSEDSDNEYILYFHSKGMVSNDHRSRQILFDYTIKNYETILNEMEKNIKIDISSLIPCVNGFAYYNFFWVRSSYIHKYCSRPKLSECYMKHDRYTWEMWLGNFYSNKKYIKTYSPIFKYSQVYDARNAAYLMSLFHRNEIDLIKSLAEDPNIFNEMMKIYREK